MAKNDVLLYGGLTIIGIYAVYVLSKNLNKAAGGAANIPVAAGNLALTASQSAGDVLTKTGTATGQVITTTGQQTSEIVEGIGQTAVNLTEITKAVSAAPLTIWQRINQAYENIAPIDYIKDRWLAPIFR